VPRAISIVVACLFLKSRKSAKSACPLSVAFRVAFLKCPLSTYLIISISLSLSLSFISLSDLEHAVTRPHEPHAAAQTQRPNHVILLHIALHVVHGDKERATPRVALSFNDASVFHITPVCNTRVQQSCVARPFCLPPRVPSLHQQPIHIQTYIHTYTHTHVCVCV
jgi:hypothetical protein